MKAVSFCLVLFISLGLSASPKATLGNALPGWQEGEKEIHFINSETGECLFCIFPDGTTMLIDAGETVQAIDGPYKSVGE